MIAVMGVEEEKVESARQVTVRLRLRGVAVETEEPLVITLPARNPKKIARAARAAQKTAATSAPPLKEVYLQPEVCYPFAEARKSAIETMSKLTSFLSKMTRILSKRCRK